MIISRRRIVTGIDEAGQSAIISDAQVPGLKFSHTPGFATVLLAATSTGVGASANSQRGDPAAGPIVPAPGGVTFVIITFPPDAAMSAAEFDPAAAGQEMMRLLPGFAELFEADSPGMHTTPTIDYAILLSGNLCLELGDGTVTELSEGDTVIQNATRHAWRNRSQSSATLAVALVGSPE